MKKSKSKILRILIIAASLFAVYLISFFQLAGVGMANDRTEELLAYGQKLMFFIQNILGFPMNLINSDYPFLMDDTGATIESSVHPLVLIGVNFVLQVAIIYWIIELVKTLRKKRTASN